MKKRILFVDDEPLVLDGLQRLLRSVRHEWEMEFVQSGAVALEILRAGHFDVLVADMMMPGMNGVQLLERVRAESPATIRLVLSGHTEKTLALQCIGVAHQFLSKPCNGQHLRDTIARVTDLGFAVRSERLLKLVGQLERLPSLPAIYTHLVALLDDPATSTHEIGALISRDTALTAHLLRIVNSAFFGLPQRSSKPADAVAYLGMDTLKAVVLTAGIFGQWTVDPASGFDMEVEADHSQKVAAVACLIAELENAPQALVEECFIAGLLHDVGKLILACNLPDQFARIYAVDGSDLPVDEAEVFGATHAEIGAYLLGLWGLPNSVVEAIRLHHFPAGSPATAFTAITGVHAANGFVRGAAGGPAAERLDQDWLRLLGLENRIPVWRSAAASLLSNTTLN